MILIWSLILLASCVAIAIEDLRWKTITVLKLVCLMAGVLGARWYILLFGKGIDVVALNLVIVLVVLMFAKITGGLGGKNLSKKSLGDGDIVLLFEGAFYYETKDFLYSMVISSILGVIHGVIVLSIRRNGSELIPYGAYYVIVMAVFHVYTLYG